MNETRLCTIEQIEQFLSASAQIEFTAHGNDTQRYEHISRVLKRFDYPRCNKRERGITMGQTGQLPRFACPDGLLRNPPCACQVKTIINMILKTKAKK